MEESKELAKRSVRLDDDVWERLQALPGKSINDGLRALLGGADSRISQILELLQKPHDTRIDEILELVRSLPDLEDIQNVVDETMQAKIDERQAQRATNPASIPGVTVGQYPTPPRQRESSFERTQREAQEREARARARSNVGDDPAYSFDPEYVQD